MRVLPSLLLLLVACNSGKEPEAEATSSFFGLYQVQEFARDNAGCEAASLRPAQSPWTRVIIERGSSSAGRIVGAACVDLADCQAMMNADIEAPIASFSEGDDSNGWRGQRVRSAPSLGMRDTCVMTVEGFELAARSSLELTIRRYEGRAPTKSDGACDNSEEVVQRAMNTFNCRTLERARLAPEAQVSP